MESTPNQDDYKNNSKTYQILKFMLYFITIPFGGFFWYFVNNSNWKWCQNELCQQLLCLYQTFIAALWSSIFYYFILNDLTGPGHHVYAFITYIFFVYCLSNALMILMLRYSSSISKRMIFVVGILSHIVGFGLKNLSMLLLKESIFNTNHWWRYLFLFLMFISCIIYQTLMAYIRPKFCFIFDKLADRTMNIIPALSSYSTLSLNNNDNLIQFQSDIMQHVIDKKEEEHKEKETQQRQQSLTEFYEYTKSLDYDAWLISIGLVSVGIMYVLYEHKYQSLAHQHINEDVIIPEPKDYSVYHSYFFIASWITMYFLWYIYSWSIARFQVHRDRNLLTKYFKNKNNASFCMKNIEKFITTESVLLFMDNCLGWCFGWSFVYIVLNIYFGVVSLLLLRMIGVSFITLVVAVFFIYRMKSFKKRLNVWLKTVKRKSADDMYLELMDNEENRNVEMSYSVNRNLESVGFDCQNISVSDHRKLFHLFHSNCFWRKALAIAYAVPLEFVISTALEHYFIVRIIVAFIITICMGVAGFKLIDIQKECHQSHHQLISTVLKQKSG